VTLLTILVTSILVAVGLGVLFSTVYPRVDISFGLASLFALIGLVMVLGIRAAWQAIWNKKA